MPYGKKKQTAQFIFIIATLTEKEQEKYEKKYEVLVRNQPIGYVFLSHDRDWHYEGMEKVHDVPSSSRQYAAVRLLQYVGG